MHPATLVSESRYTCQEALAPGHMIVRSETVQVAYIFICNLLACDMRPVLGFVGIKAHIFRKLAKELPVVSSILPIALRPCRSGSYVVPGSARLFKLTGCTYSSTPILGMYLSVPARGIPCTEQAASDPARHKIGAFEQTLYLLCGYL